MVSKTLNKHIALYADKNLFYVRNISSDVNTFASAFSSPLQVDTPSTGCLCACFNLNQTMLYFQDNQFDLYSYDLSSNTLNYISNITCNSGSIADCYFEASLDSIVFFKNNLKMKQYDLIQNTLTTVVD